MTIGYSRNYYKVPAVRGHPVAFQGRAGIIVGSRGPHLRVKFPGGEILTLHPTWKMAYANTSVCNKFGNQ